MHEDLNTTCTMVQLGISAANAATLPVLLELDDPSSPRISYGAAKYARYLQREGHASYETIRKNIAVLGKLRDFYILVHNAKAIGPSDTKNLLEDFLYAFDLGTVLGWKAVSNSEYQSARVAVADYIAFLKSGSDSWQMSESDKRYIEEIRRSEISAKHAHESLLFHTKKRGYKKSRGRKRKTVGLRQYKPFPPDLLDTLIQLTPNVRDRILFAMCAFGGRRISEYLNMYLQDVQVQNEKLSIELYHPAMAPMKWRNTSGQTVTGIRREYLKAMFNLLPRIEHGARSSQAGWKGMKFDDEAELRSEIYFIRGADGELAKLHRLYLHEILPTLPKIKHPYYFVSESGEPLTYKAAEKQFRLACRRVEKATGIILQGYGLHSLRHYYGFFHADVLKTDLMLIQKYMGHVSLSSTAVYAHISPATAHKALIDAEDQAKHEGRIEVDEGERKEVREKFEKFKVSKLSLDQSRYGKTIFGEVDTAAISRRLK